MRQNSLQIEIIDGDELLLSRIIHVYKSNICGKSSRNLVSSNRGRGIHRRHNCDSFERNKIEVRIVETLIAHNLLQEGNELNWFIFVRLGQIDVLQVDDQSLTLFGSVDTPLRIGRLGTHLVKFLDHLESRSLRIAMNNRELSWSHLRNKGSYNEILTAAFRTAKNKVLARFEQRFHLRYILLNGRSIYEGRIFRVLQILNRNRRSF